MASPQILKTLRVSPSTKEIATSSKPSTLNRTLNRLSIFPSQDKTTTFEGAKQEILIKEETLSIINGKENPGQLGSLSSSFGSINSTALLKESDNHAPEKLQTQKSALGSAARRIKPQPEKIVPFKDNHTLGK